MNIRIKIQDPTPQKDQPNFAGRIGNPLYRYASSYKNNLVGGFNPSEKYEWNWIISPRIGMKIKKYLSCHHLAILCLLGWTFRVPTNYTSKLFFKDMDPQIMPLGCPQEYPLKFQGNWNLKPCLLLECLKQDILIHLTVKFLRKKNKSDIWKWHSSQARCSMVAWYIFTYI